ncbi:ABC transporter ATP-binding protein [Roseibacillus persicicus]|uniref:ATP-binding cassette domain-containing protein n=1 Tax=Roseibacillus persicicus TaxID=454148 RepID=UPI00398B253E
MIRASKICKSFGGRQILDNLDYSIERGEIHAWKGSNGCGKTTLARLLAGLETPDSGTITRSDPSLKVLIAQQDFVLWPTLSVRQNLNLVAPEKDWQPFVKQLSFSELLKQRSGHLSHGQKQLVCLARTLSLQPDLLILDEAISHLDKEKRHQFFNTLKNLREKHAVAFIWINHFDENSANLQSDSWVLEQNQLYPSHLVYPKNNPS